MVRKTIAAIIALLIWAGIIAPTQAVARDRRFQDKLNKVQRDHFLFFKENQNPDTGLILDRNSPTAPASIASVGFGLTVYPVAVDRKWISREEAAGWTLKVLRHLHSTPQGPEASGTSGYHGMFYHFLDPATALRATSPKYWNSELSSIDTALLMAGVLFAKEYYLARNDTEAEIRRVADKLYRRVEWDWMSDDNGEVYMAWDPESGMSKAVWHGYSEGQLIYILGMGSPTHPLKDGAWEAHLKHVKPQTQYGETYILLPGGPLFTYQYQHSWIDFRKIFDFKAREMRIDWFENSKRATIAQYKYAQHNPQQWRGYGRYMWGLTACDGPGNMVKTIDGTERTFRGYSERGAPGGFDDGTIAPTAAISSIAFTPELSIPTLCYWLDKHPELYTSQGFVDSFNPTLDKTSSTGWKANGSIGIDQGPIVLMIENYRTESVWDVMKRSDYLRNGLKRCGFAGGWLR